MSALGLGLGYESAMVVVFTHIGVTPSSPLWT